MHGKHGRKLVPDAWHATIDIAFDFYRMAADNQFLAG